MQPFRSVKARQLGIGVYLILSQIVLKLKEVTSNFILAETGRGYRVEAEAFISLKSVSIDSTTTWFNSVSMAASELEEVAGVEVGVA